MTYTGETNGAYQSHGSVTLRYPNGATYTWEWKDGRLES